MMAKSLVADVADGVLILLSLMPGVCPVSDPERVLHNLIYASFMQAVAMRRRSVWYYPHVSDHNFLVDKPR
jgi:hypothetical protein